MICGIKFVDNGEEKVIQRKLGDTNNNRVSYFFRKQITLINQRKMYKEKECINVTEVMEADQSHKNRESFSEN